MSPLSNLPGPWRWEQRGKNWWRIHDGLNIEDGPHPPPPACCCAKHAGANACPDCPQHGTLA